MGSIAYPTALIGNGLSYHQTSRASWKISMNVGMPAQNGVKNGIVLTSSMTASK